MVSRLVARSAAHPSHELRAGCGDGPRLAARAVVEARWNRSIGRVHDPQVGGPWARPPVGGLAVAGFGPGCLLRRRSGGSRPMTVLVELPKAAFQLVLCRMCDDSSAAFGLKSPCRESLRYGPCVASRSPLASRASPTPGAAMRSRRQAQTSPRRAAVPRRPHPGPARWGRRPRRAPPSSRRPRRAPARWSRRRPSWRDPRSPRRRPGRTRSPRAVSSSRAGSRRARATASPWRPSRPRR